MINTAALTTSSCRSDENSADDFRVGTARALKRASQRRSELICPYCPCDSEGSPSACKLDPFVTFHDFNDLLQHVQCAHISKFDEFRQNTALLGSDANVMSSSLRNNDLITNAGSEDHVKSDVTLNVVRRQCPDKDLEVFNKDDCIATEECRNSSDSESSELPNSSICSSDEEFFFPRNKNYTSPFLNSKKSKGKMQRMSSTPYASQRRISSIYSEFALRMEDLLTNGDVLNHSSLRNRRVSSVANMEPEETMTCYSGGHKQLTFSGNSKKVLETTDCNNLKTAERCMNSHQAALWPLWELIDVDKTGEVSTSRLSAAFAQIGIHKMRSKEYMETIFKCVDINANGMLDWNKFYRFFKHLHNTDLLEGEDREEVKGKRNRRKTFSSFHSSLTKHMSGNVSESVNNTVECSALSGNSSDNCYKNSVDTPFSLYQNDENITNGSKDGHISDEDDDDPEDVVDDLSPENIRDRQLSLVAHYSTPLFHQDDDSDTCTSLADAIGDVSATSENSPAVSPNKSPIKCPLSIEREYRVEDESKSPKSAIIVEDTNSRKASISQNSNVDSRSKRRVSIVPSHRVLPTINIRRYEVEVFGCLNQRIKCISMSPRRPLVAACHRQENTVHVYDLQGREVKVLTGHKDSMLGIAFSVDKKAIATASRDKTLTIWDCTVGRELGVVEHPGIVTAVAFSADGTNFYTGCQDNIVRRFYTHKCRYLRCMEQLPNASQGVIVALATQHHANDIVVCSRSCDKCALVLDANTLEIVASLEGHITMVWQAQFNADGSRIVTLCEHMVIVWETGMLVPMQTFESKLLMSLAFPKPPPPPHPSGKKLKMKPKLWTATLFCPAKFGTLLVCFGTGASVFFFDYVSGQLVLQLQLRSTVYCAATTDDGDKVVCGDDWGNIYTLKLM